MLVLSVAGAATVTARQKNADETLGQFVCNRTEMHEVAGAGGAFYLQRLSIKMMIAFEGFYQHIIHREPDWPAPIGVATEQIDV
jgi:hypothetical protein